MSRSLSFAASLSGFAWGMAGFDARTDLPPRPQGKAIWVRCNDIDQLTAIELLEKSVKEIHPKVTFVITVTDWIDELAGRAWPEPKTRRTARAFLSHVQPSFALWCRGGLNTMLLHEQHAAGVACLMIDATADELEQITGGWVPGAIRSTLGHFEQILATDQASAEKLIFSGARPDVVKVIGELEDCPPVLGYDKDERAAVAAALGTRPVWVAAGAHLYDWEDLMNAQQAAARRAHRLLLVVIPYDLHHVVDFTENFRGQGMKVALQSEHPDPPETCQIYLLDEVADYGLWYRLAPVTFLGGTLYGDCCNDPFEPAALGSAVIYGPMVAPFQRHAARLNAVGASRLIRNGKDLAQAVESLLSVDEAAKLAQRAWNVTTQGRDVTEAVAEIVALRLAEVK